MHKYIIIICIIFFYNCMAFSQVTQCLIDNGIVNLNCTPIGDAYIGNSCIAGIHIKISRTVNAED